MSEITISFCCGKQNCPQLHIDKDRKSARITDDYAGEISESLAKMTCLANHLQEFLDGDENACTQIKGVDDFVDIFGHTGGRVRLLRSDARSLVECWKEILKNGNDGSFDIGSIDQVVPALACDRV